jgi:hypothetical protein
MAFLDIRILRDGGKDWAGWKPALQATARIARIH